jgi:hypothetical protein
MKTPSFSFQDRMQHSGYELQKSDGEMHPISLDEKHPKRNIASLSRGNEA